MAWTAPDRGTCRVRAVVLSWGDHRASAAAAGVMGQLGRVC
jgi:hypothetical protein